MTEQLLTAEQIHALRFAESGLSVRWVREHAPCVELAPKVKRFYLSAVDAWIASNQTEGKAA